MAKTLRLKPGYVTYGNNNYNTITPTYNPSTLGNTNNPLNMDALDINKIDYNSQWGATKTVNALGRGIINTIPELIKQVAYLEDLVTTGFTDDIDRGNDITRLMESWQGKVREALPIYQENPGETDWSDWGWLMSSTGDLVS